MHIINALDEIAKLELKLMDLYSFFSNLYKADSDTASVFFKLSLEEKGHAELVQYQKRVVRKNQDIFMDVSVDTEQISAVISRAEGLMNAVPPPSVEDVIKSALLFEKSAAEYHYRSAMEQSNPEFAKLLNNLAGVDNEHFLVLKKLAGRKGISDD